jgi:predicted Zn-dependent peptidase
VWGATGWGADALDKEKLRRTRTADLAPPIDRAQLANGLTLVLSPDPSSSVVVLDVAFLAGTIFEPQGKSGLAHLVEHLLASGSAPAVDYGHLLAARGCVDFNASTTPDLMTFHAVLPPAELPVGLWVSVDRLVSRPPTIDAEEVRRNLRIVGEERALRVEDVAYGIGFEALLGAMFPAPHPMHGMVLGVPAELATVTADEVRAFASRYLVPANGIVTITGNFDPATARALVEQTLGRLPGGARAVAPVFYPADSPHRLTAPEPRSRRPRATFAWRLAELPRDLANVLHFGALLLQVYTDGALGMNVDASFEEFFGYGMFVVNVTLDHEASKTEAYEQAEGLLRYITKGISLDEIFGATLLLRDRMVLSALDGPVTRAAMLSRFEATAAGEDLAKVNEGHWALMPRDVPELTGKLLAKGRFVLHARPLDPRPLRPPRE